MNLATLTCWGYYQILDIHVSLSVGGVLSCVMVFNIILFHNCNCILADEGDNSLVMWDNKIFRAPFTVENSSFIINLSFLGCQNVILLEITKNVLIAKFAK